MPRSKTRGSTRRAAAPTPATEPLIDLEHDAMRPVASELQRLYGHTVSDRTVIRAIRGEGTGGALEAFFVGGMWRTTAAAMADFVRRQTDAQRLRNKRAAKTRQARAQAMNRKRAGAETAGGAS